MNTIISSTQENSTVLLSFTSGIYDKIDISGVTTTITTQGEFFLDDYIATRLCDIYNIFCLVSHLVIVFFFILLSGIFDLNG